MHENLSKAQEAYDNQTPREPTAAELAAAAARTAGENALDTALAAADVVNDSSFHELSWTEFEQAASGSVKTADQWMAGFGPVCFYGFCVTPEQSVLITETCLAYDCDDSGELLLKLIAEMRQRADRVAELLKPTALADEGELRAEVYNGSEHD